MSLVVSVIHLAIIYAVALWIEKKQGQDGRYLYWPALGIKLLAGIGLGLLYHHYYSTGDTFYFFHQAREQVHIVKTHPVAYINFLWGDSGGEWKGAERSIFFVKLVSAIAILTNGEYWITSLWFSFISFLGCFYLFKSVLQFFPGAKFAGAIAFLFFPSVVFWGSGVIKESVGLAALMVLSVVYLKVMMKSVPRPSEFILAGFSLWIVWNLKYYWIAVFLPVAITSILVLGATTKLKITSQWMMPIWILLFSVLSLGVSMLHPNFYPHRLLQVVIENNLAFLSISDPQDVIHYPTLQASWMSILANSPWALLSGLFRPFLWEADTILKALVAVENTGVLVLSISALWKFREFLRAPNKLITLSVLVYVILLCVFLSLSTPNFGSLARYKVGFLPFLLFLICYKNPLIDYILNLAFFRKLSDALGGWVN